MKKNTQRFDTAVKVESITAVSHRTAHYCTYVYFIVTFFETVYEMLF